MLFPSHTDYYNHITIGLDQYKHLKPVLNANGDYFTSTGNFGIVFKMQDPQTQQYYALKCFVKAETSILSTYKAIAEYLQKHPSPYFLPITFLEREIWVETPATSTTEFPVVLMPWVEGDTLQTELKKACQNTAIATL